MSKQEAVAGHNLPPDPDFEDVENRASKLSKTWALWSKADVDTEDLASRLQEFGEQVRAARGKTDKLRETRKNPHLVAGRAVDDRFRPLVSTLDEINAGVKKILGVFARAKKADQDRAAAKARKEAEEQAAHAASLKEEAEKGDLLANTKAEMAAQEADKANRAAKELENAPVHVKGERSKRASALRTVYNPKITDQGLVFERFRGDVLITEALEKCVGGFCRTLGVKKIAEAFKAGDELIPGVTFETDEVMR